MFVLKLKRNFFKKKLVYFIVITKIHSNKVIDRLGYIYKSRNLNIVRINMDKLNFWLLYNLTFKNEFLLQLFRKIKKIP